jgi:hypothetical protein
MEQGPEQPEILGERRQSTPDDPPSLPERDEPETGGMEGDDRVRKNPAAIRSEDTEPYYALQYVARLFKIAALVVMVALAAEIVIGLTLEGAGAIFPLLNEVIRGIVLAAILWGAGDLTVLLIDVGHDVRAARVLLGRLSARTSAGSEEDER